MRVGTDDEVYRVDAVWLGPPKATFPWRARYVAWGIGIAVWIAVFAIIRKLGFDLSFFSIGWSLIITVAITRWITSKITHERPLGAVLALVAGELNAPRKDTKARGSALSARRLRVRSQRPIPRARRTTATAHTATQEDATTHGA